MTLHGWHYRETRYGWVLDPDGPRIRRARIIAAIGAIVFAIGLVCLALLGCNVVPARYDGGYLAPPPDEWIEAPQGEVFELPPLSMEVNE